MGWCGAMVVPKKTSLRLFSLIFYSRGHFMTFLFSLTLTLTLFYPSAFSVNRLGALSLDDSYFSFYPGMPRDQAEWLSCSFSFYCGPLSFCLFSSMKPQSRTSYYTFLVLLLLQPPYLLATLSYSHQAHSRIPVFREVSFPFVIWLLENTQGPYCPITTSQTYVMLNLNYFVWSHCFASRKTEVQRW